MCATVCRRCDKKILAQFFLGHRVEFTAANCVWPIADTGCSVRFWRPYLLLFCWPYDVYYSASVTV